MNTTIITQPNLEVELKNAKIYRGTINVPHGLINSLPTTKIRGELITQLEKQFVAAVGKDNVLRMPQINDGLQGKVNLDQSNDVIKNKNNIDTLQL